MSILTDLNPYALAAKVGVAVVIVGGAWVWGHHVGYTGEKAEYDAYVTKQKELSDAQVKANQAALAAAQDAYRKKLQEIEKEHADVLSQVTSARDSAVANADQYAQRLRQYLARPSVHAAGVPGTAAGTGKPAAVSQGSGGLSDGVSDLNRYLTQRFYTADVNAATLNEAIDLIAQDRATCNGSLPGITK